MALVGAPPAAPAPPHTLGSPLNAMRQMRPTRGFKLPESVAMPIQPNLEQYLATAAAGHGAPTPAHGGIAYFGPGGSGMLPAPANPAANPDAQARAQALDQAQALANAQHAAGPNVPVSPLVGRRLPADPSQVTFNPSQRDALDPNIIARLRQLAGEFSPPASVYPQLRAFSPELLRAAAH